MIIGQVLQVPDQQATTFYGPWQAAEGNLAVVSCDLVATTNVSEFAVTVETKNSEDSDKDKTSPAGGTSNLITLTDETITKFNVGAKLSDTVNAGFKELYRYKYVLTGAESGSNSGFVHFRMLAPAWLTH